jgi:hypothetical protein
MALRSVTAWVRRCPISPSSRLIPSAVGLVLFSAAVLKALDPHSCWFIYLLAAIESLLAIWLWCGVLSPASRSIALGLFACFAVYNWTQATAGAVSCACFGAIGLSPWMALGLDGIVIGLLIFWHPASSAVPTRSQLGIATFLFCLAGIVSVSSARDTARGNGLLEVFPRELDLGTIARGTSGKAEFVLRNTSSQPVQINQVETSCPCLDIRFPEVVEPDAEMRGEAVLDMSREPHFTGNLAIILRGKTGEKKLAFDMVVMAEVRNPN